MHKGFAPNWRNFDTRFLQILSALFFFFLLIFGLCLFTFFILLWIPEVLVVSNLFFFFCDFWIG